MTQDAHDQPRSFHEISTENVLENAARLAQRLRVSNPNLSHEALAKEIMQYWKVENLSDQYGSYWLVRFTLEVELSYGA